MVDYDELVDPWLLPHIKLLNSITGVKTLFCCAGIGPVAATNPSYFYPMYPIYGPHVHEDHDQLYIYFSHMIPAIHLLLMKHFNIKDDGYFVYRFGRARGKIIKTSLEKVTMLDNLLKDLQEYCNVVQPHA